MKSPTKKTVVFSIFSCIFVWIAAASIERSMHISGQSKERGLSARSGRLADLIDKKRKEISALKPATTSAEYLNEAAKREELSVLLWQDQKSREAAVELNKVISLENMGGADKNQIIGTMNKLVTNFRDSNNYSDMIVTLHKIQTLDEKDPSTPRETIIKDRQNIATVEFLTALSQKESLKRYEHLSLAQVMMEELKKELLHDRPAQSLSESEKIVLATNDETQAAIRMEMGDMKTAKYLQDEAQTLRSALH